MISRFVPERSSVQSALTLLVDSLAGGEHLLIEAFQSVADPKLTAASSRGVIRHLLALTEMGVGIPWVLYDTVSALLSAGGLSDAIRETVTANFRIRTDRQRECLRPAIDGSWQFAWEVDAAEDPEYREVALDWYVPPDRNGVPVVPEAIIDCIASGVFLLQDNLILPATAILLVALESVLWEALDSVGVPRQMEQVQYLPARWKFIKRLTKDDKGILLVTVEGGDKDLRDLRIDPGAPIVLEATRRYQESIGREVPVEFVVNPDLAGYLASGIPDGEPKKQSAGGLNSALERVRKLEDKFEYLDSFFPPYFDRTIVSLRNNLVHLQSRGELAEPVPIPGGVELKTVEELRSNPRLTRGLLSAIIRLANGVYASKAHAEESEV